MLLIDTSLWVQIYRDTTGSTSRYVQSVVADEEIVFCPFVRAELLQGCRDDREWKRTLEYLDEQSYIDLGPDGWTDAARIYFELRQRGLTVRSTLDCCIAVVALEHDVLLMHDDQDYERIATVRPLKHQRLRPATQGP